LIYCDPPYVHETRHPGSLDLYGVELSADDHRQLSKVLHGCKAKVVLSGYNSPLYNELYGTWRTERIEISNHASSGASKSRMQEVLWMNW
jgi:DNA adenine methylase